MPASLESYLKALSRLAAEQEDIRMRQQAMIAELRETIANGQEILEQSYKVIDHAKRETERQIHQAIKK